MLAFLAVNCSEFSLASQVLVQNTELSSLAFIRHEAFQFQMVAKEQNTYPYVKLSGVHIVVYVP